MHTFIEYAVQVQIDSDAGVSVPPDHKIPVAHGYRCYILTPIATASLWQRIHTPQCQSR